jgi:hypothetical protein
MRDLIPISALHHVLFLDTGPTRHGRQRAVQAGCAGRLVPVAVRATVTMRSVGEVRSERNHLSVQPSERVACDSGGSAMCLALNPCTDIEFVGHVTLHDPVHLDPAVAGRPSVQGDDIKLVAADPFPESPVVGKGDQRAGLHDGHLHSAFDRGIAAGESHRRDGRDGIAMLCPSERSAVNRPDLAALQRDSEPCMRIRHAQAADLGVQLDTAVRRVGGETSGGRPL